MRISTIILWWITFAPLWAASRHARWSGRQQQTRDDGDSCFLVWRWTKKEHDAKISLHCRAAAADASQGGCEQHVDFPLRGPTHNKMERVKDEERNLVCGKQGIIMHKTCRVRLMISVFQSWNFQIPLNEWKILSLLRLPKTLWDFLRLPEPSEFPRDSQLLFETLWDTLRLPETSLDSHRLHEICWNCLKP